MNKLHLSLKRFSLNEILIGTRNASDLAANQDASKIVDKKIAEYKVNPNYLNRNPRNLEWSGHAYKRLGWQLNYPSKDFYHNCTLTMSKKHVYATVEHFSGKEIIKVKSNDSVIMQHLYSLTDKSAVINIARLLADKCHRYGITQMRFQENVDDDKSSKKTLFKQILIECGIKLDEPEHISGDVTKPGLDYDNKNFYNERREIPFPPAVNKMKKNLLSEADKYIAEKKQD